MLKTPHNPGFLFCILFVFISLSNQVFPRYHPGIKWKEISNPVFIVAFPAPYEKEAIYTLNTAQEIFESLKQMWKGAPPFPKRIRILLSDAFDQANGSATFFPYNQVEIRLIHPSPDSTTGSSQNYIRTLLTHEISHIFTYNWGSGFTYFLRKIIGTNPLLFPSIYMPIWLVEGISVYNESRLNAGGRLDSPDYKIMLKLISQNNNIPHSGRLWGDSTPWPGSNSPYFYGGEFLEYLSKQYGEDKVVQFVKDYAYFLFPFTIRQKSIPIFLTFSLQFKLIFGKSLNKLWDDFKNHSKTLSNQTINYKVNHPDYVSYLTEDGYYNEYPVCTNDGRVFYVHRDLRGYPGIFSLTTRDGKPERLVKQSGVNGLFYSEKEETLYFSATDYYKTYYIYSDIYRLDIRSGKTKRLSKGQRLFFPVKSSIPDDNDKVYCVKRIGTQSFLACLDLKTGKNETLSNGYEALAFPAISPDNKTIAASVKITGNDWGIGLFSMDGKQISIVTENLGKCYCPVWKKTGELMFICADNDRYRLASFQPEVGSVSIIDEPGIPDIKHFSLSSDKQKLVASFYDSNGFNIGTLDLDALKPGKEKTVSIPGEKKIAPQITSPVSTSIKSKPYNSFRDVIPKYLNMDYRQGGNEFQPGIMASGHDLMFKHSYLLEGFYGFRSKTANFIFNIMYNGFYPSLSLYYSDLSDFNMRPVLGRYIHNERKFKLEMRYPLVMTVRSQVAFYTDIHFRMMWDKYRSGIVSDRVRLNGMTLGLFYNSAMNYYDGISPVDGRKVSLSYSRELKLFGSSFDIHTIAFRYKRYISVSRPNVLAIQFGVTESWGGTKRLFYMGGVKSNEGEITAGDNIFEIMRGYPSGYFTGTGGYLLNVEYRMHLFKVERVFLFFRSIERIYLTLFTDVGNLWKEQKKINPAFSFGGELNLITYLGDLKLNLSGGIAFGRHPSHSAVFYFRLGNSF